MNNTRPYKHPQVNLRIPQELKDQVAIAASESGRSMNAEIVHRLEESFYGTTQPDILISAKDARKRAEKSRAELNQMVQQQVIEEIAGAVRMGHTGFEIDFSINLDLDTDYEEQNQKIILPNIEKLIDSGYQAEEIDLGLYFIKF